MRTSKVQWGGKSSRWRAMFRMDTPRKAFTAVEKRAGDLSASYVGARIMQVFILVHTRRRTWNTTLSRACILKSNFCHLTQREHGDSTIQPTEDPFPAASLVPPNSQHRLTTSRTGQKSEPQTSQTTQRARSQEPPRTHPARAD